MPARQLVLTPFSATWLTKQTHRVPASPESTQALFIMSFVCESVCLSVVSHACNSFSDGMWSAHAIPPFHPGQVIDLPHVARVHYPFLEV